MTTSSVIAVTGATGFVGRHIVAELLRRGHRVNALVRDAKEYGEGLPHSSAVKAVTGTLDEPTALANLMNGAAAVVNAVGIIREEGGSTFERIHVKGVEKLVTAARQAKVNRFVQISALGVGADGVSEYQTSKWEAEQSLRRSGLEWTILRPSFIAGPGSKGLSQLLDSMSGDAMPWLFIPYFQRVEADDTIPLGPAHRVNPLIQPVNVTDVARAVAESLERPESIGEIFNLVGEDRMTWPEFLIFMRDNTPGTKKSLQPFPMPAPMGAVLANVARLIGAGSALPFDSGMAKMAAQDSISESSKVAAFLGFTPTSFTAAYPQYAASL